MRAMTNLIGVVKGTRVGKWMMASAVAATLGAPLATQAAPARPEFVGRDDHREIDRRVPDRRDDDRRDDDRRDSDRRRDDHDRGGVNLDIRVGGGPRYVDREVRVWAPATYRTECEHVWVPDVYEDRQVRFFGRGEWHTRLQHVLVTPGHYEDRDHQVLVSDGHYEMHVEHVRVADGGFGFRIGG